MRLFTIFVVSLFSISLFSYSFAGVVLDHYGIFTNNYNYGNARGVYGLYSDQRYPLTNMIDARVETTAVINGTLPTKAFFIFNQRMLTTFGLNERPHTNSNWETTSTYSPTFGPKRIYFANGYHKSPQLWNENSRAKIVAYYILKPDGITSWNFLLKKAEVIFTTNLLFRDRMGIDVFDFEKRVINDPTVTSSDKIINLFVIKEIYPGTKYSNDICISEINFENWDGVFYYDYGIPLAMTNSSK